MQINFTRPMALLAALSLLALGCGEPTTETSEDGASQASSAPEAARDHSGWWCIEHGIPEDVCSMCSAKAADDCKAKGDWCEEHNRAASQCFQCDPTRAEKFAKLYEAKYGHSPPEPTE